MRNITAKEINDLIEYHRGNGDELLACGYEQEEKNLQMEMNRD